MKNRVFYDPRNPSTRIVRGTGIPGGRQINMGADNQTKQARKTRKGAAEWLFRCDEDSANGRGAMFNPQQREGLIARANGGSSKLYDPDGEGAAGGKPIDPFKHRKDESEDEYVVRINAHIASM